MILNFILFCFMQITKYRNTVGIEYYIVFSCFTFVVVVVVVALSTTCDGCDDFK